MSGISLETFIPTAKAVSAARYPVIMRGRHGIGKSWVVHQIAEELGLPVIEKRASQMMEGDLMGLPKIAENASSKAEEVTGYYPPDWLVQCSEVGKPHLLFFDEVNRGVPEVRQGLFELTDSRKINGVRLHPDTVVYAAVNPPDEYQVGEMDPAELDRYTVFDIEPTPEDWLNWASSTKEVIPEIRDFITNNLGHLEHTKTFEPNKVYPSRRSWHRLSKTLEQSCLDDDNSLVRDATTLHLSQGFVGYEAAASFDDFLKNYSRQVSAKDLLNARNNSKVWKKLKASGPNQHIALVDRLITSEYLTKKGKLKEQHAANIAEWICKVPAPSEAVKTFQSRLHDPSFNVDDDARELIESYESDDGEISVPETFLKITMGDF